MVELLRAARPHAAAQRFIKNSLPFRHRTRRPLTVKYDETRHTLQCAPLARSASSRRPPSRPVARRLGASPALRVISHLIAREPRRAHANDGVAAFLAAVSQLVELHALPAFESDVCRVHPVVQPIAVVVAGQPQVDLGLDGRIQSAKPFCFTTASMKPRSVLSLERLAAAYSSALP